MRATLLSLRVPLSAEAAQAQGVRDHEDARERHRPARHERVEVAQGGERQRGHVVGECPEQVAFDRAEGASREANRVDGTDRLLALMNLEIWARLYLDRRTPQDVSAELEGMMV